MDSNSVNASNKLLALIDGPSIYTPFFSSVFRDQQTVMLEDIEPSSSAADRGSAVRSNAVNGVTIVVHSQGERR